MFLGLLCLLLLAGLITVVLLCEYFISSLLILYGQDIFLTRLLYLFVYVSVTKSNSEWEMKMVWLQNTNNNLTRETDQLQNERRQRDKLMEEKKQLQEKLDSMTKAKDDLERKFTNCHQTTKNTNVANTMVTGG